MNKLAARILLAALALPLLFLIAYQWTWARYLLINVACVAATFVGALEVRNLFENRRIGTFRWLAPALGASFPAASYLQAVGAIADAHLLLWVSGAVGLLLLRGIRVNDRAEMEVALTRVAASLVVLVYPGLFVLFIARISTLENATFHLLFLFALVFGNDTAAWAVGMLAGRPLGLLVSPAKSVAGFVAGLAMSLAVAGVALVFWPRLVPGGPAGALTLGVVIGCAAVLGDLIESVLKRSAGVKDSGTLMMGRGGLLDSADSLLLAAPLYYLLVGLLGR
jgi:phosphatidate cytidylyltransferase